MALLEWKDEYAIGIASVDFEHRELIKFINRIHDHLAEGDGDYATIDFLGELYAMISAHFALEEQTMRPQDVVEELFIMAMPLSAMHDNTSDCKVLSSQDDDAEEIVKPFAALRAQMTQNEKNPAE